MTYGGVASRQPIVLGFSRRRRRRAAPRMEPTVVFAGRFGSPSGARPLAALCPPPLSRREKCRWQRCMLGEVVCGLSGAIAGHEDFTSAALPRPGLVLARPAGSSTLQPGRTGGGCGCSSRGVLRRVAEMPGAGPASAGEAECLFPDRWRAGGLHGGRGMAATFILA